MRKKFHMSIYIIIAFLAVAFIPSPVFAETGGVSDKLVAITFDDGPGPYTEKLLDALKERNVKATFFVVGYKLSGSRDIILRQYNEGHQVASHSWDHPQLTKLGVSSLQRQINNTADGIREITGQSEVYLRPPYGSHNSTVRSYAGGPVILWSVDTLDWKYRNVETVKNNILRDAKDGSIILLHDIHPTSVDGAILAIDEMLAQGYEFTTVSELLRRRGIDPVNGSVYSSAPNKGINLPGNSKPYDGADFDESQIETHWAYPSIKFVQERGLINGVSEDRFAPDKYMTRAMFVSTLARWSGEDLSQYNGASTMEDVSADDWYQNALGWALFNGIISKPTDSLFHGDDFVTKETMLTMLYRYAQYVGVTLPDDQDAAPFEDDGEISSWAREAVKEFHDAGLPMASGENTLGPKENATRAQAAAFIHNFVTSYGEGLPIKERKHPSYSAAYRDALRGVTPSAITPKAIATGLAPLLDLQKAAEETAARVQALTSMAAIAASSEGGISSGAGIEAEAGSASGESVAQGEPDNAEAN